jgi:hypothetical protein
MSFCIFTSKNSEYLYTLSDRGERRSIVREFDKNRAHPGPLNDMSLAGRVVTTHDSEGPMIQW